MAVVMEPKTEAALLEQVNLAGRKTELRQFLKTVTLAKTGQGKAILIAGNEGSGKTALLRAVLDLAEQHQGCATVRLTCPAQLTPQGLFSLIVNALLRQAREQLQSALDAANELLQPLGLHWTTADLVHLVAMLRLQDSVANRQSAAMEHLSQSVYGALSFFKRFDGSVKAQIESLSAILSDPWLVLSASLVNPVNPQVQRAMALLETPLYAAAEPSLKLLPGGSDTANVEKSHLMVPQAVETTEPPTLTELQTALSELLVFVNNGLRQQQSALIIAIDQWERVANGASSLRQDLCEFLREVIRQTVELRDFRMLFVLACQGEYESDVLGGGLYTALKTKYLMPSLSPAVARRWLKDRLKEDARQWDEAVLDAVLSLCRGNPAWLILAYDILSRDARLGARDNVLDWETYQERYAVSHPREWLDMLYTRLMLQFVGEEERLLAMLQRWLLSFGDNDAFTKQQALQELSAGDASFADNVFTALQQLYILVPAQDASSHSHSPETFRFFGPFLLPFLKQKALPMQEAISTPDKVAFVRKVLPVSIQSGELTRQKTQEFLALAASLGDAELSGYIEQTVLDALYDSTLPTALRVGLLQSVPLFAAASAVRALLGMLSQADPVLREQALMLLAHFAGRSGLPVSGQELADAVLPLVSDPMPEIRRQAVGVLALLPQKPQSVMSALLSAAREGEPAVRLAALEGLTRQGVQHPELASLYSDLLVRVGPDDLPLFRVALNGLSRFEPDQAVQRLQDILRTRAKDALWSEALLMLMQLRFADALAWIEPFLQSAEVDIDLKRQILKRLGARYHSQAEALLGRVLKQADTAQLLPELRWVAIRSLGWIGQTQESFAALECQRPACQSDEILLQALESALRQVQTRLNESVSLEKNVPKAEPARSAVFSKADTTQRPLPILSSNQPEGVIDLVSTGPIKPSSMS